jgi:shikimate kinase
MTQQPNRQLIVLIGPPGAGTSQTGEILAGELGVTFRDTDADVARTAGKPVAEIFIDDGEDAFRELERAQAEQALREHDGVLVLGSGAVLDEHIQDLLAGRTVVYLAADFTAVVRHAGLDRPRVVLPGNPRGRLRAMLEERRPVYERLATITVEADGQDPEEAAGEILRQLPGTRLPETPLPQTPLPQTQLPETPETGKEPPQ